MAKSKTDAGVRLVELDPGTLDVLKEHKTKASHARPDSYVFPGKDGKRRDRHAVRNRVLYGAIKRANATLEEKGLPTIPEGVTFHSLRRTYASLCAEAGADPAWTAAQIGHVDPRFTISVYTDVRNRRESPAEKVGSLLRGDSNGSYWQSEGKTPDQEEASA